MAAMMQRRLGAKLRTADDYATADEKEIKELSAMTGIKYKQPARRPQPKRIAAPASTLVNLNELKQLAEEDGSPVKARKALPSPPETAELGDVWWNTHREETEEPAPVARSPPRPASAASSTASVRRKQKAASAAFVASASTAAVASNRQATAGRKKTAPRRKTPDARRAARGGILDDGAGPAVPRRKTPDAARGGFLDDGAGPAAVPRRRTPDAAVPRPGDPYKAAATAPRRKTPEPAAPRVVRTARVEAVVPPPRSKPRKSPAALPSLTCAPDTSFDLFAWPGEAPARDEDALLTSF